MYSGYPAPRKPFPAMGRRPVEVGTKLAYKSNRMEVMKLAFVDTQKYVADPKAMSVKTGELLSEAYAAERWALISNTALTPEAGKPGKGGTVYLCAAGGEGNMLSYIMNPQEALDRPRWQWVGGKTVEVEQAFDNRLAQQLLRAGHDIVVKADPIGFGRGEIIWRNDDGTLCGACEPRTDGCVAAW